MTSIFFLFSLDFLLKIYSCSTLGGGGRTENFESLKTNIPRSLVVCIIHCEVDFGRDAKSGPTFLEQISNVPLSFIEDSCGLSSSKFVVVSNVPYNIQYSS